MDLREQMDRIYREIRLENIPWNQADPPKLLVDAVESKKIKPGRIVDLGCGAGNYSVWLAEQGFKVVGLDISPQAIKFAEELATAKGVDCRFETADLLGDLTKFHHCFDIALDWEVMHHIFPDDRPDYIKNVHSLLRPGGILLSVCFSERDTAFGGKGKFRETPLGTTLYFSSEDELKRLLAPHFDILELSTVDVPGKPVSHKVVMLRAARK